MSPLPAPTIYRVEYLDGMGWPRRTTVEHRTRHFTDVAGVRRLLAELAATPTHHTLIGVWRGHVSWDPAFTRVDGEPIPHFDVRADPALVDRIRANWLTEPEEQT